jgi:hypothetical protein
MTFLHWLSIIGAVVVIVGTAAGAATHEWEVYCWMGALIGWTYAAREPRRASL